MLGDKDEDWPRERRQEWVMTSKSTIDRTDAGSIRNNCANWTWQRWVPVFNACNVNKHCVKKDGKVHIGKMMRLYLSGERVE